MNGCSYISKLITTATCRHFASVFPFQHKLGYSIRRQCISGLYHPYQMRQHHLLSSSAAFLPTLSQQHFPPVHCCNKLNNLISSHYCCCGRSSLHAALLTYYVKTSACGIRWLHLDHSGYKSKKNSNLDDKVNKKAGEEVIDETKLSLFQKFRLMYRQYWYVLLPVHCATSVVWYGAFFIAAKNGVDIVPMLKAIGVTSDSILGYLQNSNTGYLALAYAMYKVATPARYTVTLGCTTFSINYLKNRGYLKPVPTKEQLREMYEDKRSEMLEKRDEMRDLFEERRMELREMLDSRRDVMKEKLEERKAVLRQRLEGTTREVMERLEDTKEHIHKKLDDQLDKVGGRKEIQQKLDNKASTFKSALKKTDNKL